MRKKVSGRRGGGNSVGGEDGRGEGVSKVQKKVKKGSLDKN